MKNAGKKVMCALVCAFMLQAMHARAANAPADALSNSLHKRLGELQWQVDNRSSSVGTGNWHVWLRALSMALNVSADDNNKILISGIEAGVDTTVSNTDSGRWIVGVMGQYASGRPAYEHLGENGRGHLNVYAAGTYATWLGQNGYFVDIALRGYQLYQDVRDFSNPPPVSYNTSQYGIVGGIEFGREIVLRRHTQSRVGWFITPRAQLNAGYLSGDNFTMSDGNPGSIASSRLLNTGLGLIAGPRFMISRMLIQPYIKAMARYEFSGKTKSAVAPEAFEGDSPRGFRYEFGGGVDMRISDMWSIYLDGLIQSGLDYRNLAGVFGVRLGFGGSGARPSEEAE